MKLLLTADTQAEFSNLPECEQSLQELLQAADKYQPDAIIHAGDLKEHYNPVDLRIVKFWVRAVRKITEKHRFIILRGNHDRISQDVDSKDWLDVLRAAGAETVSQPKIKRIGGGSVGFLPFTPDKQQEIEWAKHLARCAFSGPHVLVFHTEIQGAYVTGQRLGTGNTAESLLFSSWDICFGGHLHMCQELQDTQAWYIGSPFCMDWGEANQRKGFLLYDSSKAVPKQIKTSIPGWYDAEWLAEHKITPEAGAYIRQKVPVTSKNITAALKDEEKRLTQMYEGSRIFVVPKMQVNESNEVVLTGSSDKEHIEQYIAATMPEAAKFDSVAAVAYFLKCLSKIDPGARCAKVRVLKLVGTNALSFAKVTVNYHNQGLILLKGKNLDWPKRSNGAGKTNLLSLLPAAWFGETLKEQKNDQLAREDSKDPNVYELYLRDAKGRKIKIVRGRRPHKIRMYIDGKDVSSGLTGKRKNETQGQIEQTLGFDLRMLKNSIYIDQTIANGFVFGTQKYRMDLINKLLNLERYEDALAVVKKDLSTNDASRTRAEDAIGNAEEKKEQLEADLQELQSQERHNWTDELKKAQQALKQAMAANAAIVGSAKHYEEVQKEADDLSADLFVSDTKRMEVLSKVTYFEKKISTITKLLSHDKCPMCETPVSMSFVDEEKKAKGLLEAAKDLAEQKQQAFESTRKLLFKKKDELQNYKESVQEAQQSLQQAKAVHAKVQQAAQEEEQRNSKLYSRVTKAQEELTLTIKEVKNLRKELKTLNQEQELYEFAKKGFQRSGLPMYLASGLCPLLNRAAEEYSEIFNGGKIQVVFEVADGDFVPSIINSAGSKTSEGQSVGEAAMAGIVAAFALREAAPKTNLVILDEPGHGLDPEGAKQFAQGIIKLKGRWPTIIVTTHSPIIEGILAGETTWTVEKKKNVSRLLI